MINPVVAPTNLFLGIFNSIPVSVKAFISLVFGLVLIVTVLHFLWTMR